MSLSLLVPAAPVVTLDEARRQVLVDHTDDDTLLLALVSAATAHAERWCGVSFEPATWAYALDAFPAAQICIPVTPLASVVSIAYSDESGAAQVVPDADYYAAGDAIYPVSPWPKARDRAGSVTVTFTAGMGTPEDVKMAVLLMAGHWYENREAVSETKFEEVPMATYSLLNLHRKMFV